MSEIPLTQPAHKLGSMITDGRKAFSCTVIICTRHRPQQLNRCLAAVTRLNYPNFEILVVDNAPTDYKARQIAARWKARYLIEPMPGLSRARNRGARACATDIVAFLDDDSVPNPEWLSKLVSEFNHPLVMAVTGRILALQEKTDVFHEYDSIDNGPLKIHLDCQNPYWFEMACFGGIGSGGSMAFRRQAFEIWPGFNEYLGRGADLSGGEEHYAFFLLLERGYRIIYTPDSIQHHPVSSTPESYRQRHLHNLSVAVGYFAFLFVEQPRYRRKIFLYLIQSLTGTLRPWRNISSIQCPIAISQWRKFFSYLSGLGRFLRSKFMANYLRNHLSPFQASGSSNTRQIHKDSSGSVVGLK